MKAKSLQPQSQSEFHDPKAAILLVKEHEGKKRGERGKDQQTPAEGEYLSKALRSFHKLHLGTDTPCLEPGTSANVTDKSKHIVFTEIQVKLCERLIFRIYATEE